MEEKRRESGILASAGNSGDSPASEPPPRRRVGGLKRKANALGGSSSSSTKRMLKREKAMLASFSPVHNGPLTRARQAPSNIPSAAVVKSELSSVAVGTDGEKPKEEEERNKAIREWEALEAKIEADFESIRSRDSNVHVVPNHCGWFSWEKIHPLEERSLPSFFNKKLEGRTSEVYMEIRNWIMRKFHSNPNTPIELKDLTELEVGDSDAKQEVMEFLDYWGLINFHPFPAADAGSNAADIDDLGDKESLVNSLYIFQTDEACPPLVHKPRLAAQATPSGLFPDPMAADDLLKQEGPAVEYHCNSCSADCSRKRYHCPKQADFDLCTECFNNGKFSSDMSSSDFILMEPAEAPGSGKWTDQETLLLLEALEIFKENWNEIAEHVATKTKAQCMLHFLQMPIEDAFLDQIGDKNPSAKDTTDLAVTTKDEKSVLKDTTELAVTKDEKPVPNNEREETENKNPVDEVETIKEVPKPEDDKKEKLSQESSKPGDAIEETSELEANQKTPKLETVIDERSKIEADENTALKALAEAFEDVGHSFTPEASVSFADLGNPVMGLAAFLVRLAGSDVATASARASVKSLSGLMLATRHCYILEDPPDNKKDAIETKSADAEEKDDNARKDEQPEEKSKKAEEVSLNSDDKDMREETDPGKENHDSVAAEEKQPSSQNETSTRKPDAVREKRSRKSVTTDNSEKPVDKCSGKEIQEPLKDENKAADSSSQPEESKDIEMKDPDKVKTVGDEAQQAKQEGTKDVVNMPDMSVSQELIRTASVPEDGTGENPSKEGNQEKDVCERTKDKHNIEKLKRAAISALSAAAVKAKNLAKQEEDQIRQLSISLIDKQLRKVEAKMSIFHEAENITMRVREQLERSRQRLYHERAQIIAARLGVPTNRNPPNLANVAAPRPPMMGMMAFPRPPMPRPHQGTSSFSLPPGSLVASTTSSNPSQSSDNVS